MNELYAFAIRGFGNIFYIIARQRHITKESVAKVHFKSEQQHVSGYLYGFSLFPLVLAKRNQYICRQCLNSIVKTLYCIPVTGQLPEVIGNADQCPERIDLFKPPVIKSPELFIFLNFSKYMFYDA